MITGDKISALDAATSATATMEVAVNDSGTNKRVTLAQVQALLGIASGTYTPTRSAEVNLDSNVTMTEAQYMRVGNSVTVSGRFTANATTTNTATSFEITLPVASNIGNIEDVAGVAFCGSVNSGDESGEGAEIIGSIANNTARIQWYAQYVFSSLTWSYHFTYQVI